MTMPANLCDTEIFTGLCACMGKTGDDPYCRCEMRQRGLTPTPFPPAFINHAAIKLLMERQQEQLGEPFERVLIENMPDLYVRD